MPTDDTQPVHSFFGLSYANYLVLPRSVMQAMPVGWQRQMVHLLERVGERFGHLYSNHLYDVKLVEDSDPETGEAIRYATDPLADYRHPVPELRSTVGRQIVDGLAEASEALDAGRMVFQVWFRWDDGREEMRYQRPWPDADAERLKAEVDELHRRAREGGYESPYYYKVVPNERQ